MFALPSPSITLGSRSPGTGIAPGAGFVFNVHEEILDNGLRILMAPDPKYPTVSFMSFVDAGARDELKPGTTGLAHVFEHMMFRGTKRYPRYDQSLAPFGPELNASTSQDMTVYFVNAPRNALEKVIDVEADRFQNMTFSNEAFRTELGAVREERRRSYVDSPTGTLYSRLYELAYQVHPYHHPVIGWEEDLEENMSYEDALDFYRTYYSPNRTVLAVAGGFDPAWATEQIRGRYGSWARQPEPRLEVPTEPPQQEARSDRIIWKDDQVSPKLMMGYHGAAMEVDPPDYCALDVISHLLFLRSQRLAKRLYNDLQLVENVSGWITGSKDPNLFIIYASLKRGCSTDRVSAVVEEELERLRTGEVSEPELVKAKNALEASTLYSLDRPYAIARSLGYHQIAGGDYQLLARIQERYQAITRSEVLEAARRVFRPTNRTTVKLVPKSGSERS